MPSIADPMLALNDFQHHLSIGTNLQLQELSDGYFTRYDLMDRGERYIYVKIVNLEVLALAIYGLDEPLDGITCYSVGCAVKETHRRKGLAIEVMERGLKELQVRLKEKDIKKFYVEGLIDQKNFKSLGLASKMISEAGVPAMDGESGTPCFHYKKLINVT